MGRFSYVAFDHRMNKQRIQNKKHNGRGNDNTKYPMMKIRMKLQLKTITLVHIEV